MSWHMHWDCRKTRRYRDRPRWLRSEGHHEIEGITAKTHLIPFMYANSSTNISFLSSPSVSHGGCVRAGSILAVSSTDRMAGQEAFWKWGKRIKFILSPLLILILTHFSVVGAIRLSNVPVSIVDLNMSVKTKAVMVLTHFSANSVCLVWGTRKESILILKCQKTEGCHWPPIWPI